MILSHQSIITKRESALVIIKLAKNTFWPAKPRMELPCTWDLLLCRLYGWVISERLVMLHHHSIQGCIMLSYCSWFKRLTSFCQSFVSQQDLLLLGIGLSLDWSNLNLLFWIRPESNSVRWYQTRRSISPGLIWICWDFSWFCIWRKLFHCSMR